MDWSLSNVMSLLGYLQPLVFILLGKFLDHKDPLHRKICITAFSVSVFITGVSMLFIRFKINRDPSLSTKEIQVEVKPDPWAPPEPEAEASSGKNSNSKASQKAVAKKVKTETVTIQQYLNDKWAEHLKMKFLVVVGITTFLFKQFDMVLPLAIQAWSGFMLMWNSEMCKVFVRGYEMKGDLMPPYPEPSPMEEMMKKFGFDKLQAAAGAGSKKKK